MNANDVNPGGGWLAGLGILCWLWVTGRLEAHEKKINEIADKTDVERLSK